MKEKLSKNRNTIIIILFGVIAIIVVLMQIFGGKEDKNNITIVTSTSKFYTVSNCVYRYITYLQAKDTDSLLLLLDNKYKKNNKIDNNNILDKISYLDGLYNFEARKMYEEKLNDNITRYYVYGYLVEEKIDDIGSVSDYYVIVTLDTKNKIFSITPYDGEIFGGNNEEG